MLHKRNVFLFESRFSVGAVKERFDAFHLTQTNIGRVGRCVRKLGIKTPNAQVELSYFKRRNTRILEVYCEGGFALVCGGQWNNSQATVRSRPRFRGRLFQDS